MSRCERALTAKMEGTSVKYILQIHEAKHSKEGGRVGREKEVVGPTEAGTVW